MALLNLKPHHKSIQVYYESVQEAGQLSLLHEGNVAPHFANLLRSCARQMSWTLAEQYPIPRKGRHPLRADGALLDGFNCQWSIDSVRLFGGARHCRQRFRPGS
jgi:hypothetical protein